MDLLSSDLDPLTTLEERFLKSGASYGYTQEKLREYVEERIDRRERRDLANQERTVEEMRAEIAELKQAMHSQSSVASVVHSQLDGGSDTEEDRRGKPPRIPIPKFQDKQEIQGYLETFESLAKLNGYAESSWLLALRSAVMGTKLELTVEGLSNYAEAKAEILAAHGQTSDRCWKDLLSARQGDETFHRFSSRVMKLMAKWAVLAGVSDAGEDTCGGLVLALVKQLALDGTSDGLRVFMKERKLDMSWEEFQAAGNSYQEAHGRPTKGSRTLPAKPLDDIDRISSAQCLRISVEDTEARLRALDADKRRSYVAEQKLCFSCLKPGHRSKECWSKAKCSECGGKHHVLLHEEDKRQKVVSSPVLYGAADTYLMTATALVQGRERMAIRVFFDLGAQASFVSSELVRKIQPRCIGQRRIELQCFEGKPKVSTSSVYELLMLGTDGVVHFVSALERPSLDLNIPRPSNEVVTRWRKRGISLSESQLDCVDDVVHVLLGVNYACKFMHEKVEVGVECVWRTVFGWVAAGEAPELCRTGSGREVKAVDCVGVT